MSQFEAVHEFLWDCKGWQKLIHAETTIKGKNETSNLAFRSLKNKVINRNLIVGGETALYIPDGTSGIEESVWPYVQFDGLTTKGWLGRLFTVPFNGSLYLTWPMYDPTVMNRSTEEWIEPDDVGLDTEGTIYLPVNEQLRRPIHFPVEMINYAMHYHN